MKRSIKQKESEQDDLRGKIQSTFDKIKETEGEYARLRADNSEVVR